MMARISPSERELASAAACAILRSQEVWQSAGSVLFYSVLSGELDLSPLMAEAACGGKVVALPKYDPAMACYTPYRIERPEVELVPGAFGILEPLAEAPALALKQLDLALVPGLAFDCGGRRLGRGKGHYDRLLAAVTGVRCGVAFDQQIVVNVPVEPHDILMNFILTPTRWLSFAGRAV